MDIRTESQLFQIPQGLVLRKWVWFKRHRCSITPRMLAKRAITIATIICCFVVVGCGPSNRDDDVSVTPNEDGTVPVETTRDVDGAVGLESAVPQNGDSSSNGPGEPELALEPSEMVEMASQAEAKLDAVTQSLGAIREQALGRESVRTKLIAFENAKHAAVMRLEPDLQTLLDRMDELEVGLQQNEELKAGEPSAFSAETKVQLVQYEQLRNKFDSLEESAMEAQDVAASGEEFLKSLVAAMAEIDPRTEQLMTQQNLLLQQLQLLHENMANAGVVPDTGAESASSGSVEN